MFDELINEFLPLFVIGGMNEVLVDFGEESLGLKAEAKNRLCLRGKNSFDHFIEVDPVIFSALRVKVKKFLDEDADGLGVELGHLFDMGIEHRLFGEAALAEGVAGEVNVRARFGGVDGEVKNGCWS